MLTLARLCPCSPVDLFIEQQSLDTTTPTGKLMFQVTGAFAEFEHSMNCARPGIIAVALAVGVGTVARVKAEMQGPFESVAA